MASTEDFQLFTSLRYDPLLLHSTENSLPTLSFESPSPFYMLVYHRDRMLEAAQHFEWSNVAQRLADGKALHKILLENVQSWQKQTGTEDGPLKLRILFDHPANLSIDISPVPTLPLSTLYPPSFDPPKHPSALSSHPTNPTSPTTTTPPTWTIRLDPLPTPISPFTSLKTTHRPHYDTARTRALPSNPAAPTHTEVMLHNPIGELTEGTMTSLYLFRGGRWVTPPVGPPGPFTASELSDESDGPASDEGELRTPFEGRWGHSVRSGKVGSGGQRGTSRRWALGRGLCMEETVGVGTVRVGEGVWVSSGVRGFGFGRVVE